MAKSLYTYTFDDGGTCIIRLDEFYGEQAALGFTNASESNHAVARVGGAFKPRHARVITAAGVMRSLPCGTPTATAYANANTAVNIRVAGATTVAHSYGYEGEKIVNDTRLATFA